MREKEAMQAQQMKRPKKEVWVNSGYNFELTDPRRRRRRRRRRHQRAWLSGRALRCGWEVAGSSLPRTQGRVLAGLKLVLTGHSGPYPRQAEWPV